MKKGFIVLFLGICMLCIRLSVHAASWQFIWDESTTTVEVPLGGNLQNYIHIPKATLCKDGNVLSDASINYITTGDWLYLLTDVDTSRVGDYQVWYKAVEKKYKPGQCMGYKTLVTFKVVDLEKPIFLKCPEKIQHYIGATKPSYEQKILVQDNSGTVQLIIDDSAVQYDRVGEYIVYVDASDGYNSTTKEIYVEVKDSIGPVITFLGENNTIVLSKNEKPNLISYFKAIDAIDGDVTSSIDYLPFKTTEEGSFPLQISFHDYQDNFSNIEIMIEIRDESIPVIDLFEETLILDYRDDFQKCLMSNIKRAYLGSEDIKAFIQINSEQLKKEVGVYQISYQYQMNGKNAEKFCDVHVLSTAKPIILIQNIQTEIGNKVDIKNYIQVEDASDKLISNRIEYDESAVDYTKPGVYPVTVCATNTSNLTSYETLYVTVLEKKQQGEGSTWILWLPVFIILGISLTAGGIFFWIWKKKKLHS